MPVKLLEKSGCSGKVRCLTEVRYSEIWMERELIEMRMEREVLGEQKRERERESERERERESELCGQSL